MFVDQTLISLLFFPSIVSFLSLYLLLTSHNQDFAKLSTHPEYRIVVEVLLQLYRLDGLAAVPPNTPGYPVETSRRRSRLADYTRCAI